jgi:hypothetical protein
LYKKKTGSFLPAGTRVLFLDGASTVAIKVDVIFSPSLLFHSAIVIVLFLLDEFSISFFKDTYTVGVQVVLKEER